MFSSLVLSALLRQSNPNWAAYFFVTDDQPFDVELKSILAERNDPRLNFLNLDAKFRPKVRHVFRVVSAASALLFFSFTTNFDLFLPAVPPRGRCVPRI